MRAAASRLLDWPGHGRHICRGGFLRFAHEASDGEPVELLWSRPPWLSRAVVSCAGVPREARLLAGHDAGASDDQVAIVAACFAAACFAAAAAGLHVADHSHREPAFSAYHCFLAVEVQKS